MSSACTGPGLAWQVHAVGHLVAKHGFVRVRFADPLKAMMRQLGPGEREIDGDLKEVPSAILGGQTPRYAMQHLGTEWGRNLIHPDLWVMAWKERAKQCERVVADDCRFPNEVQNIYGSLTAY